MFGKKFGLAMLIASINFGTVACSSDYEPMRAVHEDADHRRVQMGYCNFNLKKDPVGSFTYVYSDPRDEPHNDLVPVPGNFEHVERADPRAVIFVVNLEEGSCSMITQGSNMPYRTSR